jgi:type II secretory pathway component PulC
MRLAVALLAVALSGSVAVAEQAKPSEPKAAEASDAPAKPAKLNLRVVRVMPESHQALLFDKNRGTHVLIDLGDEVGGYKVTEIDDDSVTLSRDGSEVVLAAPYRRGGGAARDRGDRGDAPDAATTTTAKKQPAGPQDPYADAPDAAAKTGQAPQDPYAEPGSGGSGGEKTSIRTVEAPTSVTAGDGGVRVAEAPDPQPKTAAPPPATTTTTPPPATTTPPATTPAVATTGDLVMTRAAFRAELADFGKLAAGVKAAFIPAGVRLDAVTAGSLFARAGLRPGDVITAVNGQALRTIDDAAELYAHASSVKAIAIDLSRGGKAMTLHVAIQ